MSFTDNKRAITGLAPRGEELRIPFFPSWFYATIDYITTMISTHKWMGLLVAAFVAGSFVASPELRAYAADTVFSTDIVDGQDCRSGK